MHHKPISRAFCLLIASAALAVTGCDDLEEVDDTFTELFNSNSFQMCQGCHAPNAPGFTQGTESTQDWSTRDTAFMSLTTGTASGLIGNFEGCNGVPFIGDTVEDSLIVAAFDQDIRASFSLADFPDCNVDSISDMTLKIGNQLSANELALLKQWISDGAPN